MPDPVIHFEIMTKSPDGLAGFCANVRRCSASNESASFGWQARAKCAMIGA